MASEGEIHQSDSGMWNPGKYAVWSDSWPDPADDRCPTTVLLRHPTAPFVSRSLAGDTKGPFGIREVDLQKVAFDYLSRVSGEYIGPCFPTTWLDALKPGGD